MSSQPEISARHTPRPMSVVREILQRRRWFGAGLVLMVVAIVALAARWDAVRVPGSPTSARTKGIPAAGACVAVLPGPNPPMLPLVYGPGAAAVSERSVVFFGCANAHVGEVIAIRRIGPGTDDAAGSDTQWCTKVAVGYREHRQRQVRAVAGGMWSPAATQRFVAILSGPEADAKGSRWAACAVLAPGLEHYEGSFVRAATGSPAPAPFGFCWTVGSPGYRVSCQTPHDEQVFGTAKPGEEPRPDSCRKLVQQATAMSDVTGGGRLEVGTTGAGSSATCRVRVVGPKRLTGTLIGIGDGPLPLHE